MVGRSPLVSVVIPAFNVAPYIGQTLRSVSEQTCSDLEVIIVDDGSTDSTRDVVASIPDSRVRLTSQPNAGVSHARNRGIALARGEYLHLLDGDDFLHPRALERLTDALEHRPLAIAAYGTFIKVLENNAPQPRQKPLHRYRYPSGDILSRIIEDNILLIGSVLLRTRVARQAGGFNPRIRLCEDWEFWCRVASHGDFAFIGNVPEVMYVRLRRASSSRGLALNWENFQPAIDAVLNSSQLRQRFRPGEWTDMSRRVLASHLWEFGRVSFCARRYSVAHRSMWRSLIAAFHTKRSVMLALSYISRAFDVSIVPRLRFNDHDQ
jgi:glycosyltransferase involved in cell wall biosynthesis